MLDPELEPGIDLCYQCRQWQFDWDCEYDNWRHQLAEQSRIPEDFDNQTDTACTGAASLADSQEDVVFLSCNVGGIGLGPDSDLDSHTEDPRKEAGSNNKSMSINGSDDVRVDIPSESENIASKHWDDPFSDAGYVISTIPSESVDPLLTSLNP